MGKVQLDPPDLCQVGIVKIPENESRIEEVVCCQNYIGTITTFTIQLWNCDLSNPENRAQKTWELDISNQTSFPKIKLSSICLGKPSNEKNFFHLKISLRPSFCLCRKIEWNDGGLGRD